MTRSSPTTVVMLANPECAHCMHAVDVATQWAVDARVPIACVDVRHHPEVEATWDLETSPVLLFRSELGERVCVGMPDHAEFARLLGAPP